MEDAYLVIKRLHMFRDALEKIEIKSARDVVPGWVCIPCVEWDAIMERLKISPESK